MGWIVTVDENLEGGIVGEVEGDGRMDRRTFGSLEDLADDIARINSGEVVSQAGGGGGMTNPT